MHARVVSGRARRQDVGCRDRQPFGDLSVIPCTRAESERRAACPEGLKVAKLPVPHPFFHALRRSEWTTLRFGSGWCRATATSAIAPVHDVTAIRRPSTASTCGMPAIDRCWRSVSGQVLPRRSRSAVAGFDPIPSQPEKNTVRCSKRSLDPRRVIALDEDFPACSRAPATLGQLTGAGQPPPATVVLALG